MLKDAGLANEPRASRFTLGRRKLKAGELERLARAYKERAGRDQAKLERMEAYARRAMCRWKILHEYFGEEMPEPLCGICDNCRRGIAEKAEVT
jgi:ATP-dependent DNA helicase RecQ